jgi:hypothetical protein
VLARVEGAGWIVPYGPVFEKMLRGAMACVFKRARHPGVLE